MEILHTLRSLARSGVLLVAVAWAALAACASHGTMTCGSVACDAGAGVSSDEWTRTVPLDITNAGELDIVVYAYRYGERYRLGDVVAHSSATLHFPLRLTDGGSAQLFVHRIGEQAAGFLTNEVHVAIGDRPTLYVQHELQMSSLAVFPDRH
jgi:hypothetical protein